MHNNFTIVENKNIEEIQNKFISLFQSINFYSGDQKQSFNKSLCRVSTK